jgi:nitronate monooxygenase
VPQIVDKVSIPILAAGGISDARGVRAAMALGADGVVAGSAFLVSDECGVSQLHKDVLLDGERCSADETVMRKMRSGRSARGFWNGNVRKEGDVIPYPIYSHLTKGIMEEGAMRGEKKSIALWAGSSASLCRGGSAAEIFERLAKGLDRE